MHSQSSNNKIDGMWKENWKERKIVEEGEIKKTDKQIRETENRRERANRL